jgi:hypothetical protein
MAKIKRSHRAVLAMAKAGKIFNEIKKIDEEPEPMNVDDVFIVLRDMQDVSWSGVKRSEM